MKKSPLISLYSFALLFGFILGGCAVNPEENSVTVQKNSELPPTDRMPGIYPDSIRVYDIIGNYPHTTWKDMDAYYKNDISKYHLNKDYTDNLKKLVIFHMVKTFYFIKFADNKTIEFYVQQQMTLPIINTEVFIPCLQALKGYWPDKEIKSTAISEYNRLMDYVTHHMKEPEKVLERNKANFDKLLVFGENYPDK
ncbi:MAG: hypothetical protein IPJ82_24740 [Lewinellaceae bacterium]|nr:hypothetical protein [Lewinellaceae bacterium]